MCVGPSICPPQRVVDTWHDWRLRCTSKGIVTSHSQKILVLVRNKFTVTVLLILYWDLEVTRFSLICFGV